MPYIKRELRPIFDEAVELVKANEIGKALTIVMNNLEGKDVFAVDGCLNYFFTQTLKKVDHLDRCETVIIVILIHQFLDKPRYLLLERALGLITAMRIEFKRRGWRSEGLYILERIYNLVKGYYVDYEDKKIKDNGDLE